MKHRWIAPVFILALMPFQAASAASDGTGFATGSCALDGPIPGSGQVFVASTSGTAANPDNGNAQAVIDSAPSGSLVILQNGVYAGGLKAKHPNVRIRGESRNGTILDGGGTREMGIEVIGVDYVVIENMTARKFRRNAFFWYHAHGWWGRYLTAHNTGQYGVYAFDSRCGQLDHSYGSGNADSAFYIGECFPCDSTITDSLAESNALGYSGTNAGGNLILKNSVWRYNALGIVPNSLDGEDEPPQRGATIKNNLVHDNNTKNAPGTGLTANFYGVGIAVAGGVGNMIYGNVVTDHALGGIVLAPLPDRNLWIPSGNTVWGNTVSHNPVLYPESYDLGQGSVSGAGNCWHRNSFGNSAPAEIETIWACSLPTTPPGGSPLMEIGLAQGFAGTNGRTISDWKTWPLPEGATSQADAPSGALPGWLPDVSY